MMSSVRRHDTQIFRAIPVAFAFLLAIAITLVVGTNSVDASKVGAAASKANLPVITKVTPLKGAFVGQTLTLKGRNFVKGKKALIVIFKRPGSVRQFTGRGDATSSTKATVKVPDVSGDLVRVGQTGGGPKDNMFRLRAITKYGAAKSWTNATISPIIEQQSAGAAPIDTGPSGNCDSDTLKNGVDPDDDNDGLADVTELSIGTDLCRTDTDFDDASDYYEWRVALQYNGGDYGMPYPALRPYPNPLVGDSGNDFDNDGLLMAHEYRAWQYTGLTSHFYSDADQDSDNNGRDDSAEDEDHDLLPNFVELKAFQGGSPQADLNWLKTDTDGDGLCDGLDDQDHDGPPTLPADGDCSSRVPNNGPNPNFPASGLPPTGPNTYPGGDPNGKIDGDDNRYSNFYEWYIAGADPNKPGDAYLECLPSVYPESPYCQAPWLPLPTGP